jgi:hypothetical protein
LLPAEYKIWKLKPHFIIIPCNRIPFLAKTRLAWIGTRDTLNRMQTDFGMEKNIRVSGGNKITFLSLPIFISFISPRLYKLNEQADVLVGFLTNNFKL